MPIPRRARGALSIAAALCASIATIHPPNAALAAGAGPERSGLRTVQQTAPTTARTLNGDASELMTRGRHDAARSIFERAIELARQEKDPGAEAFALRGLGLIHSVRAEYAKAIPFYTQALAVSEAAQDAEGQAAAHLNLFSAYSETGERSKAVVSAQHALDIYEASGNLRAKGYLLRNMLFASGDPREDESLSRQALEIAARIGDLRLRAIVLHDVADRLINAGQFADAREKLTEAISLFETNSPANLPGAWTSMGRMLRLHGQPEQAIGFYEKALTMQVAADDRRGIMQTHNAMSVAYAALGDYARAGDHIRTALDLARQAGTAAIVDTLQGSLAGNFLMLDDYARAAALLEEVVQRGKDPRMPFRYSQLSEAYIQLGRLTEALAANDKSLALRTKSASAELYDDYLMRARILAGLKRTDEGMADLKEAMRLLEEQRAKAIPADLLKQGFNERVQSAYDAAVDLLNGLGRTREALGTAELARSRAFLDLLATREVTLRARDAADLAHVRQAESSLELQSSVTAAAFSVDQLAATAKRLNSTMVSYWVGDKETSIWVISGDGVVRSAKAAMSRNRLVQLIRVATGDSRGFAVRGDAPAPGTAGTSDSDLATRGEMTLRLDPASRQAWRDLHDALWLPIRRFLPVRTGSRLTIIPHGPLFRLSFAALQDARGRYLIEDYELHYAPAGAVLDFTQRKKASAAVTTPGDVLLVADPGNVPLGEDGRKLAALPGARDEAARIAQLMPAGATTTLSGAAARETRVRTMMRGKRILHFATHGIIRDEAPLDSFLALGADPAGGAVGPGADGRLSAREIYSLDLDAQLVFLSACRSGLGKVSGDGVVGLTRAFIYGGAPTVVATLWDVADAPTVRLVAEFYRRYTRRESPAAALRAAQLQLLADLRAGRVTITTPAGVFRLPEHPALWAGLILVGEPR
jgi:CHAT domain-containing protein/tetratricopeptide (TPR) repeat protein